jgi:CheY-like chemotaxis protein
LEPGRQRNATSSPPIETLSGSLLALGKQRVVCYNSPPATRSRAWRPAAERALEGAGRYVLLVDDDPQVRRLLTGALESWGYEVQAVGTGEEALDRLGHHCPDVLISDLIMPGMSGEELARRCTAQCPATRLVFVSGYGGSDLRELGVTQVVYLPKPLELASFRVTLRQLLEG